MNRTKITNTIVIVTSDNDGEDLTEKRYMLNWYAGIAFPFSLYPFLNPGN